MSSREIFQIVANADINNLSDGYRGKPCEAALRQAVEHAGYKYLGYGLVEKIHREDKINSVFRARYE